MLDSTDTRQGIVLAVVGLSIAAFTGAIMKLLSEEMSAYQITWFRFLGMVVIMIPIAWARIGADLLKPARLQMQMVRGITMSSATVLFVLGAKTIEFADAIAILYAYPFLMTVLALFFLGETVRIMGWVGVVGGFVGVLLVMRPEFNDFNIGSLLVFLCAVVISIQMVINRKLGSLSHPLVTTVWGAGVATLSLSLILPFYWQPVTLEQSWLIGLMVVSGSINQTCLVFAFAKAEASTLAPFTYFEIVAGVLFGLLIFGTLPDWLSWSGIVLIIVSGLLVTHALSRKQILRRPSKI